MMRRCLVAEGHPAYSVDQGQNPRRLTSDPKSTGQGRSQTLVPMGPRQQVAGEDVGLVVAGATPQLSPPVVEPTSQLFCGLSEMG